jgi:hypothetical protein
MRGRETERVREIVRARRALSRSFGFFFARMAGPSSHPKATLSSRALIKSFEGGAMDAHATPFISNPMLRELAKLASAIEEAVPHCSASFHL